MGNSKDFSEKFRLWVAFCGIRGVCCRIFAATALFGRRLGKKAWVLVNGILKKRDITALASRVRVVVVSNNRLTSLCSLDLNRHQTLHP